MLRTDIRLALPSKGVLQAAAIDFLENCGLRVFRPNPRQYAATIPNLHGVTVIFQRPGDIVTGVKQGSLDFGVTGLDVLAEQAYGHVGSTVLTLHDALGFGPCTLNLAVPEDAPARTMADLAQWAQKLAENGRFLRVATKFTHLTTDFLAAHNVTPVKLIEVEGTLEIAPSLGTADLIADLVSSGKTLSDNHLRPLDNGEILRSQACLIANRRALTDRPEVLEVARQLLEYFEAHLRAVGSCLVTANVRGDSPEAIAERMFHQPHIGGLQGPTISRVIAPQHVPGDSWYAVNIVVRKENLVPAIAELRAIGGSGVIVAPCTYIFEEEPERYKAMLAALHQSGGAGEQGSRGKSV